jgi:hypothetical protein
MCLAPYSAFKGRLSLVKEAAKVSATTMMACWRQCRPTRLVLFLEA